MRNILIILIAAIISGCVTAPKNAATYDQVEIKDPDIGKAILVFYRTNTPPAAYHMRVLVNDSKVAELPNEAFSWVELDLGMHKVKVEWSAWSGIPSKTYDIDLQPGGVNFLELNNATNVPPVLGLVLQGIYGVEKDEQATEAMYEVKKIQKCCRYVPSISSNKSDQQGPSAGTR